MVDTVASLAANVAVDGDDLFGKAVRGRSTSGQGDH
jgi:hypothetical protein